ncbi:MAG: SdiA-regulated domain-containing protein [Ignavibacteria bacterium]|nr:SdiA-regulated domain-containing protein [Ignavibacteria bacterium]
MKTNAKLLICISWIIPLTLFGCGGAPADSASQLRLVNTYKLSFGEPSGITYDEIENVLWIVSGADQKIYKTNTAGVVLKKLSYTGEDLEGIALDSSGKSLWIVEERKRELIQLDLDGSVLLKVSIPLPGKSNSGLEGVAKNEQNTIFLLNEKKPGKFVELNSDLTIKSQTEIYFADDFSDMVYSAKEKCFFVLSDENRALYKWTKETGVIQKFSLPKTKYEGVAVNSTADKFFLVNDETNELSIYSLK